VLLTASTGAMAQVVATAPATPNCSSAQVGPIPNLSTAAAPASAVAGALSGAIGNINTIFLTQQGSAFVSAPPNPAPDQPGGGVWARAVGGQVNLTSTSTFQWRGYCSWGPVSNHCHLDNLRQQSE